MESAYCLQYLCRDENKVHIEENHSYILILATYYKEATEFAVK